MSFGIWYFSRIKIGTKRTNFYTGFWKGSTGRVAMREKTLSFVYFEAPYTTKWKKNRQTDKRTLKDCRFENIDYSKYQLIFVTAEEVFSMPFLSRLKQLPHLFNHRLYVCLFLSEDSASGFFI